MEPEACSSPRFPAAALDTVEIRFGPEVDPFKRTRGVHRTRGECLEGRREVARR